MSEITFDQNIKKTKNQLLDTVRQEALYKNYQEFTIEDLLLKFHHLPEKTALLGLAGSESPVMFDLVDENIKSVLCVSDHLPSLRRIMMVMIESISKFNRPDQIQYLIFSDYPEKWAEYISKFDPQFDFCSGIVGGYETVAEDWILYLSQLADSRHHGRRFGPTILLFIDDLKMIENFDIQVRLNYEWLLRNGAKVNVWPISAIDLQDEKIMQKYGLQFKTKIVGLTDEKLLQPFRKQFPPAIVSQLKPNRNFVTKIGSEWIQFWVPKLHS